MKKILQKILAYFKIVQFLSNEELHARLEAIAAPYVAKLEQAKAENEVQAAQHEAEAARHAEATEQLNILINLGVVKMNTQAEHFNTRN